MSIEQLTEAAMALPLPERASLAHSLWESIDTGVAYQSSPEILAEAVARDRELACGEVGGLSHEAVMLAARRALGCE